MVVFRIREYKQYSIFFVNILFKEWGRIGELAFMGLSSIFMMEGGSLPLVRTRLRLLLTTLSSGAQTPPRNARLVTQKQNVYKGFRRV